MSDPAAPTPGPAPSPPGQALKPARGPTGATLDADQRAALLDAVAAGKGLHQSLRAMGAAYRLYRNTVRDDPDFRLEVASARRAADDQLDEIGRLLAMSGNDEVLLALWGRRDRGRELNRARADRRRERAEDRKDRQLDRALRLHLGELSATVARAKFATELPEADDSPLDLSRLTSEELAMFRSLVHKAAGDPLPGYPGTIAVET